MEFWGVEVKPGKSVKCPLDGDKYIHLSQASLGESKGKENVPVFVKINDQKLVLGTLSAEKCTQLSLDLVFEKEFELSHTSKNTSVFFCGYKTVLQDDQSDDDDLLEDDSEPEDVLAVKNANGKPIVKQDQGKPGAGKASAGKEDGSAAKKAKKVEPTKDEKPKSGDKDDEVDSDDEDDDPDSEEMVGALSDSDDKDEDEDESSEEEKEATPKKTATGKRPAESTSKTPVPEKKAKVVTPAGGQKTGGDGKKVVHVATPHPAKKAGKTPGNSEKSKQQQSPKSAGSVTCKSCSRIFNSDNALQAHTKAKHG